MADLSQYDVVTFQRKPGIWRASVTPIGRAVSGKELRSIVTSDDCASEDEARKAATRVIKDIEP